MRLMGDVVVYASPQIGVNYSNYPNIIITDAYAASIAITSKWATAVGYTINMGVMWEHYDFGMHVVYASPEFIPSFKYYKETGDFLPETKPVKALGFTIGRSF